MLKLKQKIKEKGQTLKTNRMIGSLKVLLCRVGLHFFECCLALGGKTELCIIIIIIIIIINFFNVA